MNKFSERISNDNIKNYFVQGFVLVDVDGASLNNWGSDSTNSQGMENTSAVKKVIKNGRMHAVVAGQAWRYWWRQSLGMNGWELSPITREAKVAFTDADPLKYKDDDVFGYMKATKEQKKDKNGNPINKKNGNPDMEDISVTRVSPLKNSILTSVTPIGQKNTLNEFSTMARQDGNAVPYEKQSYSTVLKGMFSLDLDQLGTFTKINRSGYKNVNEDTYNRILENGIEVDDLINPNVKRARLKSDKRISRAKDTILALKTITGGAKRTTNYASVKPDFIVLAVLKGGNNIFDNICIEENGKTIFYSKALKEAIKDNLDYLRSDVYLAKASGFMEDVNLEILKKTIEEDIADIRVHVGAINEIIDSFVETLNIVMG